MKKGSSNLFPATGRSRFFVLILFIIFGMCVGILLLNAIPLFFPHSPLATFIHTVAPEIGWLNHTGGTIAVDAIDGHSSMENNHAMDAQNLPDEESPSSIATPQRSLPSNLEQILAAIFDVLPASPATNSKPNQEQRVNLGRLLFFDPSLSINGTLSCNDCHNLQTYGVDGMARSLGVTQIFTNRNTPSVYNAAIQKAQFWDGRSPTVEDQATIPILAEHEMGMINAETVETRLNSNAIYPLLFKLAFPDESNPVTLKNVGIAIGTFERGLLTPARFDKFLTGDYSQLNEQEIRGLDTFISLRCITCHSGVGVGGSTFTPLGVTEPYETRDIGRFAVTNREEDKFVFKVPSLRNVAKTAPYLHDGSIETIDEVVRLMARYQLGKTMTESEVDDVVAFLDALTGEIPSDYVAMPELP